MKINTLLFLVHTFIILLFSNNINSQVCDAGNDIFINYDECADKSFDDFDLDAYLAVMSKNITNKGNVLGRRWVYKNGPKGPRGRRVVKINNEKKAKFPNTGAGPEEEYSFYYIVFDGTCIDTAVVEVCTKLVEPVNKSFEERILYITDGETVENKEELFNAMTLLKMRDLSGELKEDYDIDYSFIDQYSFPLNEGGYTYRDGSLNEAAVLVTKIGQSTNEINFTFENAQNTNDGVNDYYEVDVMIQGNSSFKLGNGKLFFNYNTEAFGEYANAYERIEVSYPDGYILGQAIDSDPTTKIYNEFETFDNANGDSTNRFSFKFNQFYSSSFFSNDNIDVTAKKLCHLKIKYVDVNKPPMLNFESDGIYDNQFTDANRTNLIVNDFFNSSGATLSIGTEQLTGISVYPNPSKEIIYIASGVTIERVDIYDMIGKQVLTSKETKEVNVNHLQKGLYLLKLYSDNASITKKIIIE